MAEKRQIQSLGQETINIFGANPELDGLFKAASLKYFGPGGLDWRWFKAQAIAESWLNPHAISPAGAMGLMQLMPGTSLEMATKLGLPNNPLDTEIAIKLGVAYNSRCWKVWVVRRTKLERIRLMLASYNAGPGNILKAQKQATKLGLPNRNWGDISPHLSRFTGHHAQETINYVSRVEKFYNKLILYDGPK